MNEPNPPNIHCGHCGLRHATIDEIRECSASPTSLEPDWERLSGPHAMGRSLVIRAGAEIPQPWETAPRIAVSDSTIEQLQAAWSGRVRTVFEITEPIPEPASIVPSQLHQMSADVEPAGERLHHLVFSNSVDARNPAAPTIAAVDAALRSGAELAPADLVADVVDPAGAPLWCDGGPLTAFHHEQTHGVSVVPRAHLAAGRLDPLTPCSPAADLAPDQMSAVSSHHAGARIVAPAGSGKTRVLTERARHLVADLGVSPTTVCLVAFNVKARHEMQSRTADLSGLQIRTLNGLALAICRGTGPFLAPPDSRAGVIDERGVRDRIRSLIKAPRRAMTDPFAIWIEAFTACRLGLRPADEVEAEFGGDVPDLAAVIDQYREGLANNGEVDFDEQIVRAIGVLLSQPDCRAAARVACANLLVDEFQDLTPAHLLLIRLLAGPAAEVFGVGDDDQTIYGYSGASPSWLIDYSKWFPGSVNHDLHVNYRCAPEVVDAAVNLLSHNRRRIPKRITPRPGRATRAAGSAGDRKPMSVVASSDPLSELCKTVADLTARGVPSDQIAVLTRVNATLLAPMLALRSAGVLTSTPVDSSYLRRTGVAAAIAWMRLATAEGSSLPADAMETAARRPPRGISPKVAEWSAEQRSTSDLLRLAARLKNERDSQKVEDFATDIDSIRETAAGGADTATLLAAVKDTIGLGNALETRLDASKRSLDRSSHGDDLDALISVAHLQPDPERFPSWLASQLGEPRSIDGPGVTLSTIHRVKGMEWPHVVVHGIDHGLCPHRLSSDVEEERRIFHVAITRSSESTTVIAGANPSGFLAELDKLAPPAPPEPFDRPVGNRPSRAGSDPGRQTSKKPARPAENLDADDRAIFDHLRKWRAVTAKSDAVPAYIVFNDRTLAAIAATRPTTESELLAVPGLGPAKLERYGSQLIEMMLGL